MAQDANSVAILDGGVVPYSNERRPEYVPDDFSLLYLPVFGRDLPALAPYGPLPTFRYPFSRRQHRLSHCTHDQSAMPGVPRHLAKVAQRRLKLPHTPVRNKPSTRAATIQSSIASTRPHDSPFFPCVEAHAARESRLRASRSPDTQTSSSPHSGPEPPYARPNPASYKIYRHSKPMPLTYAPALPEFDIAYETWGELSPAKDNVILLHTGLSASSHAASTDLNPSEGWWEQFIGPGRALDTNQFFIICTNVLGGCYGSTGPSSADPSTGKPYATHFPVISIFDMVRAQFCLLDHLGIDKLYASVGSSMGAMQSLAAGWLYPERVGKVVSISGTARSSPSAIAMRFAQRSVLMADPNWKNGFYYEGLPPHTGMKLARQIATITYRSGPEWDQRFGRKLKPLPESSQITTPEEPSLPRAPAFCPDFLIETYLDYQGESFCLKYDANSLIYISKAMDVFDLTRSALSEIHLTPPAPRSSPPPLPPSMSSHPPSPSHSYYHWLLSHSKSHPPPANPPRHLPDLAEGLRPLSNTPTLILGVQSDILFPVEQQREVADALRMTGNQMVSYYELGGVWGHDTFLLDVQNIGGAIRGFLC